MIKMETLTFWVGGNKKKLDFLLLWYVATGLCAYAPIFLTSFFGIHAPVPPSQADMGIVSSGMKSYRFSEN